MILILNPTSLLLTGDNGTLTFWDWNSGTPFQTLDDIPQPGSLEAEAGVFCSAFDQTGTRLITGGADKTIKVSPFSFFYCFHFRFHLVFSLFLLFSLGARVPMLCWFLRPLLSLVPLFNLLPDYWIAHFFHYLDIRRAVCIV